MSEASGRKVYVVAMISVDGATGYERGLIQLADGRALCWRANGAADDPTLLWLHGSTGSSRTAPTLPGVRVISYDRPGYGGSTHHPQRNLFSDASDVEALLNHLGIDQTTLLAFSGGAAIAYAAAVRTPQRLTRLGIVSGAPWPTAPAPSLEAGSARPTCSARAGRSNLAPCSCRYSCGTVPMIRLSPSTPPWQSREHCPGHICGRSPTRAT
jgi:pimeloyl-ACP methyl ester carboxylesterase